MRPAVGRMMDQHDAEQLLALELSQQLAEAFELVAAQTAGRHERRVGSAVDSPISATGPRLRTNGNALAARRRA